MSNNQKSGVVQSLNISPKGTYEGLLLESKGERLQINFPPDWGSALAALAAPGTRIEAQLKPKDSHPNAAHPVYDLLYLSNDRHESFSPNRSTEEKNCLFSGVVLRLNYALHGEVNGAILDSGDFLHLKPHGAAALNLVVGMKVKGAGSTRPMVGGTRVIEAEEVNGQRIRKKPRAPK